MLDAELHEGQKIYIEKDSGKQLQIGSTPTDRKIDGLSTTFLQHVLT